MTPKPSFLFKDYLRAAIREGRKTQTRRVLSPINTLIDGRAPKKGEWEQLDLAHAWIDPSPSPAGNPGPYFKVDNIVTGTGHRLYPRAQPGDVWYMREPLLQSLKGQTLYADDGNYAYRRDENHNGSPMWLYAHDTLSSMLMPAWAARTFMLVLRVWPERIQDIGEEDAMAEGFRGAAFGDGPNGSEGILPSDQFATAWDSINARRPGCGWADNPPVWAFEWKLTTKDEANR